MALAPGRRLGPYDIVAPLGAGGMGEVYKARDTRLDRSVAIKVLPADLSTDADRRARFEREARAISALNHPNICTLHDMGRHDGVDYLVMELVDGETLADRIRKGPLPFEEVLKHGETLAEALFAAHRQGIVHRDLKPGNVMLGRAGLKLLDFGLAKWRATPSRGEDVLGNTPTETSPLSNAGAVVGTCQYMSPEQLEGKEADGRADIWALGCVLFEMATATRPFDGASTASVAAAILQKDPPSMGELQPQLPRAFEKLVRRCLAKDPDERWQSARDLAFALRSVSEARHEAGAVAVRPARNHRPAWLAAGLAGLAAVAALAWGLSRPTVPAPLPVARFTIRLPEGDRLPTGMQPALALSPDGQMLVYAAERGSLIRLYLRRLNRLDAEPLPGTDGGLAPFFSPDGQWIGFFADRKLKKMAVAGGAVFVLCDAPDAWGGSWSADGSIVFNGGGYRGLFRVSAAGGTPQEIAAPNHAAGEYENEWPHVLPEGRGILYSTWPGGTFDQARIAVVGGEASTPRILVEGGFAPQYLHSGHLLYARRRGLFATPLQLGRLERGGTGVRVLDDVQTSFTGAVQATVSENGTLAFIRGGPDRRVLRVNASGIRTPLIDSRGAYTDPALSPDGKRLALTIESETDVEVWVADLERGTLTRLTAERGLKGLPRWSRDGKRIAFFGALRGETNKVYWQAADGSGPAERLTTGPLLHWPHDFSPDGQRLLWGEFHPETGADIWELPLAGDQQPRPLLRTAASEDPAVFSPDGRYIAYVSDESGHPQVYVIASDGRGAKWPVSTDGGSEVRWVGGEILYRSGDRVMSAAVRTQPAFSADRPRVRLDGWFESCQLPGCHSFDVTRDGRDLIVLAGDRGPATEIEVVLGWFYELETRMQEAASRVPR